MNKAWDDSFVWKNYPSEETPLDAIDLNKINNAVNTIDNRVVSMDITKLSVTNAQNDIVNVTFAQATGIFTFTRRSGATFSLDTVLEKVVTNFTYDRATQCLILTYPDGTKDNVNLSAFIQDNDFADSDTISFSYNSETKVVSASVKNASITGDKLQPNYLADCQSAKNTATEKAAQSESDRLVAEGYSSGTQNGVPVSEGIYYHNNAKYYKDEAAAISGGGVTSFNGRYGSVSPQDGDYKNIENAIAINLIPYPYADGTTKEHNGITFTVNADGSIVANGTASGQATFTLLSAEQGIRFDEGKSYTLSGVPSGFTDKIYLSHAEYSWNGRYASYVSAISNCFSKDVSKTITYPSIENYSQISIMIVSGTVCDNLVFKPMLELGNIAHDYIRYIADGNHINDVVKSVADKVSTVATDLNGAKTDITTLQTSVTSKASKSDLATETTRIDHLYEVLQGKIYSAETHTYTTYEADVPSNALSKATIDRKCGRSVVVNQICKELNNDNYLATSGATVTYSDGIATITPIRYQGIQSVATYNMIKNHKYLTIAIVKLSNANDTLCIRSCDGYNEARPIATTEWQTVYGYGTVLVSGVTNVLQAYPLSENPSAFMLKEPMLIDLTQMFGGGNEPSLDECRKIFTDYIPYNVGTLTNIECTDVKGVGKNLLNCNLQTTTVKGITFTNMGDGTYILNGTASATIGGEVVFGRIHLEKGTYKFIGSPSGATYGVNQISMSNSDNSIGPTDNGNGVVFTIDKADDFHVYIIVVSGKTISNSIIKPMITKHTNLTYADFVPYNETHLAIPNYNLKSANTVADEVVLEKVLYKNMKSVDLGSLNWTYDTWFYTNIPDCKPKSRFLCTKYVNPSVSHPRYLFDKSGTVCNNGNNDYIYFLDSDCSSASDFKSANNGVILWYEANDDSGTDKEFTVKMQYVGSVDMGSLTWEDGSGFSNLFFATIDDMKKNTSQTTMSNVSCIYDAAYPSNTPYADKCASVNNYYPRVYIHDTSYSSASDFGSAMDGVMLNYELANPLTYLVDDVDNDFVCEADGTVEFVNSANLKVGAENVVSYAIDLLKGVSNE